MSNTNYFSPQEIAAYDLRKRQADEAIGRAIAGITSRRDYATQGYGINVGRAGEQYARNFRQLPGSFARRGVLRSGIYKDARERQTLGYDQQLFDMRRQYEDAMRQLNEQQGNLEFVRNATMEQIDFEKLARQQAMASDLSRLMGMA